MVAPLSTSQESIMGKGDKRSRRGKTFRGSYGNVRPHKVRKAFVKSAAVKK